MKVSIIIPNYNGRYLLAKNLPSIILAKQNPKNRILEIIIVDDSSTDDSVSFLTSEFKKNIKLVKHTKNRGFSSSVNTGVRASRGDFVLLLNTDVSVKKDFLEKANELFKDNKVFAVSLHESGYGYAKVTFTNGYIELSMGKEETKVSKSFYVSGGSGIYRKSIWKYLGGMDEMLLSPYYWEDIDLSFRASKRGYINLWSPDLKVKHDHESTISKLNQTKVARIRERNQLLVIWKNIHSKNLIKKHIVGVFKRVLKHPGYIRVILMAITKLPKLLKERQKEIKESKVSDEAVFQGYS